jgi:hypothetical protein
MTKVVKVAAAKLIGGKMQVWPGYRAKKKAGAHQFQADLGYIRAIFVPS